MIQASSLAELPDMLSEGSIKSVRDAIADFGAERQRLQTFVAEMMNDLESVHMDLIQREQDLAEQQQSSAVSDDQLTSVQRELEQLQQELSVSRETVAELTGELDDSKSRLAAAGQQTADAAVAFEKMVA